MKRLVSEGRKREFAAFGFGEAEFPDPEDLSSFEASKLKWSEVHEGEHAEMLAWTRDLIHLRRSTLALNDGDLGHLKIEYDREQRWLAMQRGSVRVLVNLGEQSVRFDAAEPEQLRLCSRPLSIENGSLELPPMTLIVMTTGQTDRVG
jgi:maltooligosyltrehalose trehalohydrolase